MKTFFLIVGILVGVVGFVAQDVLAEESAATAGYHKGFYVQSADGNFKLNIGGYLQPLFQAAFNESAANTDTFRMRRARVKFSGHIFTKNVRYTLLYDFAGPTLNDAYLDFVASDAFCVRTGQFKVPFNFEGLNAATQLQLVDRSIAQGFFGVGGLREPGVSMMGSVMDGMFEYALGAFNGEGINTLNGNAELRYAGRVVFNAMGHVGNKGISDIKGSEKAQLAIAAAGMFNDTMNAAGTDEQKTYSMTGEVNLKYMGLGLHSAFLYQRIKPDGFGAVQDKGVLFQAGYLLVPEKWEVAARVVQIFADSAADTGEYTLGVNRYLYGGNKVKLQADYSLLTTEDGVAAGNDSLNHRIRAQATVAF